MTALLEFAIHKPWTTLWALTIAGAIAGVAVAERREKVRRRNATRRARPQLWLEVQR